MQYGRLLTLQSQEIAKIAKSANCGLYVGWSTTYIFIALASGGVKTAPKHPKNIKCFSKIALAETRNFKII